MNRRSCQSGMPECGEARMERRDTKNDVVITSNFSPSLLQAASARGMFGSSMKPKRRMTRWKWSESRKKHGTLADIVERQGGQHKQDPCPLNGAAAKVTHIR